MPFFRLRRACAIALCLAGLAASPATAVPAPTQAYAWKNVAVGGGGFVTGLVFHPSEPGLLYARTDIGGAYRWMPETRRWRPLLDWMGPGDQGRFGVESLALDPSDPDRLYLAVGTYLHERGSDGAILRSRDRGTTFERTALPFKLGANAQGRGNGERLAVDPNDGDILLFGTRADGLWRSDDAGVRWAKADGFPASAVGPGAATQGWNGPQPVGIVFVVFDPASGGNGRPSRTVYAGIATGGTSLFRSTDGGLRWNAIPGQPTGLRPNHMVRDARGRYLLSYGDEPGPNTMSDGAVWRFDPSDGSWTDITPVAQDTDGEGDGFGWGAVAVDAGDPDVIVATTFNRFSPHDELFRSTDGGKHWRPMLEDARFERDTAPWTADARPHWMADVEIDPHDPDRTWFVTGYGIWASTNAHDRGVGEPVAWRFEQAGFEETVPLALASPPEGAHLVSGLGDIDGFVHDDLDASQARFAGVRFSNTESLAFAGQQPGVMVRTGHFHDRPEGAVRGAWSEDGGRTWTAFTSEPPDGEGAGRITIAADGHRVLWSPRRGGHWLSLDRGRHWQEVVGLPETAVVEADRVAPALFHGYDPATGRLYASGDGGASFEVADVSGAGRAAVGDGHRVEIEAHPTRPGEAWIAAGGRGLLRWKSGRLRALPGIERADSIGVGAPVREGGPLALYLAGQVDGRHGLFRSDDDGAHWVRIDDDRLRFSGIIRHVTGDPRIPGRVYFGTEGRGIWYGDPR
ncbi:cellulase [Lysobacter sp. SG-8]|uniref:Cellulase n=1 Tax=Marilutibacter penaei TaxID=2759900 RepID=A0A7W3U1N5_9GAMM|nr:sialidase family protein [Lysobacter penaei]MBB1086975.1 cellulase [Lysobacter penaei]